MRDKLSPIGRKWPCSILFIDCRIYIFCKAMLTIASEPVVLVYEIQ